MTNKSLYYMMLGLQAGIPMRKSIGKQVTYLTFSSTKPFDISTNNQSKNWNGDLYYSTDKVTWDQWNGESTILSMDCNGVHYVYMRGIGNTSITGNNNQAKWVLNGTDIRCDGNIENLLDYRVVVSGVSPTMADYCYRFMFRDCTSLTVAPELPATMLSNFCYSSMFYNCTNLTTAPELPATQLAAYCYSYMFYGCNNLLRVPALPAMTLADGCCYDMFYNCTNLITAPGLPATTLASSCYYEMFYGCKSLITAPVLPATTLAASCYQAMFRRCTGLTTAPQLPATTLTAECYKMMFTECASLTIAPALPATELARNCYNNMFSGCVALTALPELHATTLPDNCYLAMFAECDSIKLSTSQTDEYTIPYRIPVEGDGTAGSKSLQYMFTDTGGTFSDSPSINTTYYLHNSHSIVQS